MIAALHSDRSLVARSLRGSRDAFGYLVERHHSAVYAVAFAVSRNHSEAEDAVQDAFVKAFESLPTLREPQRFRAWVAHICRNLCRDRWRAAQRTEPLVGEAGATNDLNDDVSRDEIHGLVREQLRQIDDTSREVLVLHYFGGLSTREIGDLLEISQSAVKKRLERGRAALSKQLLSELREGPETEGDAERLKRILLALAATTPAWFTGLGEVGAALGAATVTKIAAGLAVAAALVSVGAALLVQSQGAPAGAVGTAQDAPGAVAAVETAEPVAAPASPKVVVMAAAEEADEVGEAASEGGEPRALSINLPLLEGQTLKAMSGPCSINMELEDIANVFGFIGEYLELGFVVVPPADPSQNPALDYVTEGMLTSVHFEDAPLQDVFAAVLPPLGLEAAIEPGFFWISTPERIRQEVETHSIEVLGRYNEHAGLLRTVTLNFDEIHIIHLMDYVSEFAEVNVVVDMRVVPQPTEPFYPQGMPAPSEVTTDTRGLMAGDFVSLFPENEETPTKVRLKRVEDTKKGFVAYIAIDDAEPKPFVPGDKHALFEVLDAYAGDRELVTLKLIAEDDITHYKRRDEEKRVNFHFEDGNPKPGVLPYINMQNALLADTLPALTRPIGYSFRIMPGYILVGQVDIMASLGIDHDHTGEIFAPKIASWLEAPFQIAPNVDSPSLGGFVESVEGSAKHALGEDFDVRLASPDLSGRTVPAAGFIEAQTPMAIALDAILQPVGLTWSVEGHTLTIGESGGE